VTRLRKILRVLAATRLTLNPMSEARPREPDRVEHGRIYCGECGCDTTVWRSLDCRRCRRRPPLAPEAQDW
jgi:hypothetical protein